MKKFFSKLSLICLVAVLGGVLSGCDPTKSGKFSVSVKEVGASYVDLEFRGPEAVEVAYILDTKEQLMENPAIIFQKGVELTVSGGDVVRVTDGVTENTKYYIYLVAALDKTTFSEIFTLSFETSAFEFDQLVTILDTKLDGYRARLTLPESTKEAGNAIRWSQCDIMMYNYMGQSDYVSLLYNGGSVEHAAIKDTTIVYSEELNFVYMDTDSDEDGTPDLDFKYNPISPGEPIVFIAGEFAYMEDSPEYETDVFKFPSGWEPGYYKPLIDESYYSSSSNSQSNVGVVEGAQITRPMDSYWTGAFQRKFFRIQEPALLDGGVDVQCVEASPIDLILEFRPDDNVDQYAVGIFDDAMYNKIVELLGGNKDYLQWAMTSYFAAYTFGTKVVTQGAVQMSLTDFYYQDAITEGTNYHVLVTAMGDASASSQSFKEYAFQTTTKEKDAPVIVVTPVQKETTPYKATFNIKCTTAAEGNSVTQCYYAANYLRDWVLAINSGSTYYDLVAGNKAYTYFNEDEIELINSAEGYNISIPSLDGETTRIAVLGYNDEYSANDLTSFKNILECPAVADCTTPYADPKPWVNPEHYLDLDDVWTASATLTNSDGTKTYQHSSKITLAADLYDYPETLSDKVYEIYEKEEFDKEEVDAMWVEFKNLAKTITEERLVNQNRLVGIGWLDKDTYDELKARTPYDLFIATDYNSVDVSSLYNDFGPKWYLETAEDEDGNISYFIPIDSNLLPPASNWSVPFTLAAYDKKTNYAITYGSDWTPSFPVTVSADRNTITIHPLEYEDVMF